MKKVIFIILLGSSLQIGAQTWTNYTTADGLIEGNISSMMEDDQGIIWVSDWSSDSPGIGNFDGTTWQQFGTTDGTTGNRYFGMEQDVMNGDYWFGGFLFTDGVDRFDGTVWENFTTTDGLAGNDVIDIINSNDGNLWMACSGAMSGLTVYNGVSFSSILADGTTLPQEVLRYLDQDSNDVFWIGTQAGGVISFDGVDYVQYTTNEGLSSNEIEDVFVDSNDIVWAGADIVSGGGLNRFDGTTWTIFTEADGLPDPSVRAINEDSNGNLWFGTNGGVSKYDGTTFTNYDETDGLIENHVRSIVEDMQGNLWFGTWGGVSKFNPVLGVFDTLQEEFVMYPNPANSILNIQSEAVISKVDIYSMLGNKIITFLDENITQLDVSSLSRGNYLIKVTSNSGLINFQKISIY